MEVARHLLDDYLRLITEYVRLVPNELIFDIDESGFRDWERGTRSQSLFLLKRKEQLSIT
jgi:hypothetical protein